MAFDVEAAKQAGYTDEEINAYLQGKPKAKELSPVAPGSDADIGEPPPPTTTVTPAGEGSMMPAIGTAAVAAAPYAMPAVATGAGLYAAKKVGGWGADMLNVAKEGMEAYRHGVNTANEIAQQRAQTAAGHQAIQQQKINMKAAPSVSVPSPTYNVPTANTPSMPPQTTAPSAQPTPAKPPQMTAAQNIVQKLALSKLLQGAGPAMAMGQGLFGTSPEEIAIMKEAEARKRAQGWKPLNER